MGNLNQNEWKKGIKNDDNIIIMDVRTPEEIATGKIPNALELDIFNPENFKNEIDKMDKSKSYYIYCRSGNRSGQACVFMESLGFEKTYNLMGGMLEWNGDVV